MGRREGREGGRGGEVGRREGEGGGKEGGGRRWEGGRGGGGGEGGRGGGGGKEGWEGDSQECTKLVTVHAQSVWCKHCAMEVRVVNSLCRRTAAPASSDTS